MTKQKHVTAIKAKRKWMKGEISNKELAAASFISRLATTL